MTFSKKKVKPTTLGALKNTQSTPEHDRENSLSGIENGFECDRPQQWHSRKKGKQKLVHDFNVLN